MEQILARGYICVRKLANKYALFASQHNCSTRPPARSALHSCSCGTGNFPMACSFPLICTGTSSCSVPVRSLTSTSISHPCPPSLTALAVHYPYSSSIVLTEPSRSFFITHNQPGSLTVLTSTQPHIYYLPLLFWLVNLYPIIHCRSSPPHTFEYMPKHLFMHLIMYTHACISPISCASKEDCICERQG